MQFVVYDSGYFQNPSHSPFSKGGGKGCSLPQAARGFGHHFRMRQRLAAWSEKSSYRHGAVRTLSSQFWRGKKLIMCAPNLSKSERIDVRASTQVKQLAVGRMHQGKGLGLVLGNARCCALCRQRISRASAPYSYTPRARRRASSMETGNLRPTRPIRFSCI